MIRTTTPRRQPEADRALLPAETRAALRSIAADLRNMPRDCIGDRAELLFWLNRIARRVDAERDRTVVVPASGIRGRNDFPVNSLGRCSTAQTAQCSHANGTARDRAEAVFRPAAQPTVAMPPKPRTVTSRKGRSVRVEIRRSLQIEMGF